MRKISFRLLLLSAAGLLLMGVTSCTREFTCQCVMTYSGVPGLPDTTVREYPITNTKKEAKTICEGNSATYQDGDITTVERCYLW